MIADTTIKRPALRYYGGKWNLAPWIISFFPPHQNYVEPCGGAASVLLQKPRSPLETYNDLDGNVVNFFRVLRDRPDELIRKIRLTPWAREEYEYCRAIEGDDLERARRYFAYTWESINGGSDILAGAWKARYDFAGYPGEIASGFVHTDYLMAIAERFQNVQIEHLPALELIEKYSNATSLLYCDPPYVLSTRANPDRYAFEWSDAQHIEAAALLRACAGYVVVSGYACELYRELYEAHGWERHDKESQTNSGGKRIESVWLSPKTVEALNRPKQVLLW